MKGQAGLDDRGVRERILNKVEQAAEWCDKQYHGCARCTMYGIQQFSGIRIDDSLIRGVTAVSGGVGRDTYSCGAYVAGVIAIGLCYGPPSIECSHEPVHADVTRFREAFIKEFGSTTCRDIQQRLFGRYYDLTDPRQKEQFMAMQPPPCEKCGKVGGKAARLAVETIMDKTEWQTPCLPV